MSAEAVETLIIGGGQAGLTMSHMLSRRRRPHLVVERGRIAERWRSERWDGLRFQFPNWSVRLPDCPFRLSDRDAFATSNDIVDYIESYASQIGAPVRCGVEVTALRLDNEGKLFVALTPTGTIAAANVVIATGPYQRPAMPDLSSRDCDLFQVHASAYKRPDQLPAGAVLVVGSGASGGQIAEELVRAGRQVYLSVGRHKRVPRRYRGYDLIWWLETMRLDQMAIEQRGPDATLPLITGAYGGHTIDLREFAAQGVTLLGRLQALKDGVLQFADDLGQSLDYGDAAYDDFLERVDRFVEKRGMAVSADPEARARRKGPPEVTMPVRQLNVRSSNLGSIVWATGYQFDYSWINLPVLDADGRPKHDQGVGAVRGIYFLGLPWLSKMSSSFLSGVADDAVRLADHIDREERVPSLRDKLHRSPVLR